MAGIGRNCQLQTKGLNSMNVQGVLMIRFVVLMVMVSMVSTVGAQEAPPAERTAKGPKTVVVVKYTKADSAFTREDAVRGGKND